MKSNKVLPKTRFLTNRMCPFAQKAWISLEQSGVDYKMEEISLYGAGGKPDWFWELNPSGTVPVLVVEHVVLPDSDLILNAIAEGDVGMGNSLVVSGDEQRKEIEQWRKVINNLLPIGKKAVLGNGRKALEAYLQKIEARMSAEQAFLVGESVSIADCHAFPFLWRLDQEYGLKKSMGCPRLGEWVHRCSSLPSFSKTIPASWWWWW